jgi:hypothetical protein
MSDFVALTCPNCGGQLQITPDIDRFACTHCGNEHLVKRGEGVIAIQPLAESMTGLRRATDRTAFEMAIRRLTKELAQLQAARQHTEAGAAEHRKVIAAHQDRKVGCQTAVVGAVMAPLCYLTYTIVDYFAQGQPEGSFVSFLSSMNLLMLPIFGLMAVWFVLKWLLSSDPTPARGVAEERLRVTEADISSLTERMSQKQAEIGRHSQLVALGE